MFGNFFNKKPQGIDWKQIHLELNGEEKALIQKFVDKPGEKRLEDIMILGDSGNLKIFRIMQYTIIYDPDLDVKFAALKRIHLFKTHPDILPMLLKMQTEKIGEAMEPYFSMALSRAGLITPEEFERKMNK